MTRAPFFGLAISKGNPLKKLKTKGNTGLPRDRGQLEGLAAGTQREEDVGLQVELRYRFHHRGEESAARARIFLVLLPRAAPCEGGELPEMGELEDPQAAKGTHPGYTLPFPLGLKCHPPKGRHERGEDDEGARDPEPGP